jgi:hypothetical protein
MRKRLPKKSTLLLLSCCELRYKTLLVLHSLCFYFFSEGIVMADPEITKINCNEFDSHEDEFTAHEFDKDRPVARFNAREKVEPGALAAILAYVASKWRCPRKKCPQMKLTITLSRPRDAGCVRAQQIPVGGGAAVNGSSCSWTCDWTVRIDCVEDEIAGLIPTTGPDGVIKQQALDCDDEEMVATGMGTGIGSNVDAGEAIKAAKAAARESAQRAIQEGVLKVHCLKEACPTRKITVLLGPVTGVALAPSTYAVAGCPWGLKVECVK